MSFEHLYRSIASIGDDDLKHAVASAYQTCFEQGYSPWLANYPAKNQQWTQADVPMGDTVFKQVSSGGPDAVGQVSEPGNNYQYGPALPQTSRDIGEETRNDNSGYKFPRINYKSSKSMKRMKEVANEHIPAWGQYDATPLRYFNNLQTRGPWDQTGGSMSIASGGGTMWTA